MVQRKQPPMSSFYSKMQRKRKFLRLPIAVMLMLEPRTPKSYSRKSKVGTTHECYYPFLRTTENGVNASLMSMG